MKIAITGSNGIIGQVLIKGLIYYDITPIDLPECDVTDIDQLRAYVKDVEAIIHLAWNSDENCLSNSIDPNNSTMYENVYQVAQEENIKKVIMASSVHVSDFMNWQGPGYITSDIPPDPVNAYGRHKVEMEKLGKIYAAKGLEVICVRFGGVAPKDRPWDDIHLVGLTHPDCVDMIEKCIIGDLPNKYAVFYAVSNNQDRVHDFSNPFGWKPKQIVAEFYDL